MTKVYTIGFTRRGAEDFFETLKRSGIRRVLDIRLSNTSQLAGFTKKDDLPYFLRELCGAEYLHNTMLSPTPVIFDAYRKRKGSWQAYEEGFLALMAERQIEKHFSPDLFDMPTALLCTEPMPEHCHRRLVLEYLQSKGWALEVVHL